MPEWGNRGNHTRLPVLFELLHPFKAMQTYFISYIYPVRPFSLLSCRIELTEQRAMPKPRRRKMLPKWHYCMPNRQSKRSGRRHYSGREGKKENKEGYNIHKQCIFQLPSLAGKNLQHWNVQNNTIQLYLFLHFDIWHMACPLVHGGFVNGWTNIVRHFG